MFTSPGEVAFSIFGFSVYNYGIVLALAILIGVYSAYFLYKVFYNDDLKADLIIDFSPLVIILGILGARLYYCLVNFDYYSSNLIDIFNVREGGLSIHGMIIVGIISLYIFAKKYKMSFLKLLDVFFCATPLGQAIGRWGNFFNSEAFGFPTDIFCKLYIPIEKRPHEFVNYDYFHPTFLYESVLDLFVFIILLFLFKKLRKFPGVLACIYLILYSFVRILVESIRIDSVLYIFGYPVAQLISFLILVFAVIFLIVLYFKYSRQV